MERFIFGRWQTITHVFGNRSIGRRDEAIDFACENGRMPEPDDRVGKGTGAIVNINDMDDDEIPSSSAPETDNIRSA